MGIYPPFGKYLSAAILHDYLFWRQVCDPEDADKIIYQTMRDAGVKQAVQSQFYVAIRTFGDQALADNRADKAKGLIRVIPEDYLAMLKPTTLWSTLRADFLKANVKEATHHDEDQIVKACKALGNEIAVKSGISAVVFGR